MYLYTRLGDVMIGGCVVFQLLGIPIRNFDHAL
jgi:hypothetical protein